MDFIRQHLGVGKDLVLSCVCLYSVTMRFSSKFYGFSIELENVAFLNFSMSSAGRMEFFLKPIIRGRVLTKAFRPRSRGGVPAPGRR